MGRAAPHMGCAGPWSLAASGRRSALKLLGGCRLGSWGAAPPEKGIELGATVASSTLINPQTGSESLLLCECFGLWA